MTNNSVHYFQQPVRSLFLGHVFFLPLVEPCSYLVMLLFMYKSRWR